VFPSSPGHGGAGPSIPWSATLRGLPRQTLAQGDTVILPRRGEIGKVECRVLGASTIGGRPVVVTGCGLDGREDEKVVMRRWHRSLVSHRGMLAIDVETGLVIAENHVQHWIEPRGFGLAYTYTHRIEASFSATGEEEWRASAIPSCG
jgi:hypothetical protein